MTLLIYFCLSAFMKYYDDPGGMIPTWLINWAAKVNTCPQTNHDSLHSVYLEIFTVTRHRGLYSQRIKMSCKSDY